MLTQNLVVRDDYLPKDDKFDPKVSYARTKVTYLIESTNGFRDTKLY